MRLNSVSKELTSGNFMTRWVPHALLPDRKKSYLSHEKHLKFVTRIYGTLRDLYVFLNTKRLQRRCYVSSRPTCSPDTASRNGHVAYLTQTEYRTLSPLNFLLKRAEMSTFTIVTSHI
jgi:hypothetical protein